ncbi:expressed unknown protein [Seminavis robusta]|uniref:Uncharacterized protein n=1 Tax=Seminavis robusta TaxID=568900 RepID=A0A9N8E1F0_9STRA|nr:expressed unknown protein [Seminavis robusta]|eukprot:Sro461_g147850.1 n/a (351) ;mRNA; f:56894-57946
MMNLPCTFDDVPCWESWLRAEIPPLLEAGKEWATHGLEVAETWDPRIVASCSVAVISAGFALLVVYFNMVLKRQHQRQRALWKKDNMRILDKVTALTMQLEERQQEVDFMKRRAREQKQSAAQSNDKDNVLMEETTQKLLDREEECRRLQATVDALQVKQKAGATSVQQLSQQLNFFKEQHNDHFCQLLEQKLETSQLRTTLSQQEGKNKELLKANDQLASQIEELQETIKTNTQKAETIIGKVSAERDERFSLLQEENDVIKTTVMNMLQQAQTKFQDDKALLKWKLQKQEAETQQLRAELRKANAVLEQLEKQQKRKSNKGGKENTGNVGSLKGLRNISFQAKAACVA